MTRLRAARYGICPAALCTLTPTVGTNAYPGQGAIPRDITSLYFLGKPPTFPATKPNSRVWRCYY